jgi:hypothetical protein
MYNLCRVFKTNQLGVPTVKSSLDPHMINLPEDEFKLLLYFMFMVMMLHINCGMVYTYIF